jgi:hypothetical protein
MVPSRFARVMMLLLAAIQFAAPAVTSVADGIFANRVVDPRAHVEELPTSDCEPPHSADCTVCRYLVDHTGTVPPATSAIVIVAEQPEPVVSATAGATGERLGVGARGPPAIQG